MNPRYSVLMPALFALAASTASQASSPTDWGVHDPIESTSMHAAKGSFEDIFSFSLGGSGRLDSFAAAAEKSVLVGNPKHPMSIFSIDDGLVRLYQGVFGDATPDALRLSYGFESGDSSFMHTAANLAPGSYYYAVSGSATGQGGGFFNLTSVLSPVPEPETYMMLLAGLGLIGFVVRRRLYGDMASYS